MKRHFCPELLEVSALEPYRLCTRWSTGETLEVDVGDKLRSIPALEKILVPKVFAKAHIAEWGGSVEWFDTEFGADNVYAWAKEQASEPPHEMLNDCLPGVGVAAKAGGVSRMARHVIREKAKPSSPTEGYGMVKLRPKGSARRLADVDVAELVTNEIVLTKSKQATVVAPTRLGQSTKAEGQS